MKFLAVWVLLLSALLPVVAGLAGTVQLDTAAWSELFKTPGLVQSLTLSVWTGSVASVLALALAHVVLAAAVTGGWSGRLRAASLPLLATPHLAVGIGLTLVLAPSGLLLRFLSPWATGFTQPPDWATIQDPLGLALILGLVIKEAPFLLLALFAALGQVPAERLVLQTRTLGYGRLKGWLVAVAPLLQRQIRLPVAAVLVFGMTNVEMALPLGPRTPPPLALVLWQWFTSADLDMRPLAMAGSVLLMLASLGMLGLFMLAGRLVGRVWRFSAGSGRRVTSASGGLMPGGLAVVVGTLGLASIIALLLRSIAGPWRFPAVLPEHLDPAAWSSAASVLPGVAGLTLALGATTALLAVLLVLAAAEPLRSDAVLRQRVAMLLFVPLLIPQMSFLFGLQILLLKLRLDGTLAAVVWSHLVFALPYVWGLLAEARASLDPRFTDTARLLGAGRLRVWLTVTAPLLLRSTLLGLALAFGVSVAVYLPTLFAGGGRVATLATSAAAAMTAGDMRYAAAHGAAQALLPLTAFVAAVVLGRVVFRRRLGVPG